MARRPKIERGLLFVFGLSFLALGVYIALRANSIPSAFARHRLAIAALVSAILGFVFIATSIGRR